MFQIKKKSTKAGCVLMVMSVLLFLTAQSVCGQQVTKGTVKTTHVIKVAANKTGTIVQPTFASIKPLLVKNTCISCHSETKRQVGPAFVEVAKRKYSASEITNLIHSPEPMHWPDYSTPMPPMPQVSKADAKKIANWIQSLEKSEQ